jgi:hypothetical protein
MMGEGAVHRRVIEQINHPVVLHRQAVRHAARRPYCQDQIQILIGPERSVRVVRAPGHLAKAFIEVSNEVGRIGIGRLFGVDSAQA